MYPLIYVTHSIDCKCKSKTHVSSVKFQQHNLSQPSLNSAINYTNDLYQLKGQQSPMCVVLCELDLLSYTIHINTTS